MRATLAATAALALAPLAALAQAEEIVPGATYEHLEPGDIPAHIHLVTLDLTASELTFDATRPEARGQTPSEHATATGAALAVNGGSFSPVDFSPHGIAIGEGIHWPDSEESAARGSLLLRRAGLRTAAEVAAPGDPPSGELLSGADAGLAGGPMLVEGGTANEDFDCGDWQAMPCERAPRTAAALAAGGTRLVVAVADGWRAESPGATAAELSALLAERGAETAILLDGGSASALFAGPLGGLVSEPSDGAERPVANHLAVVFDELEPGEMTVLVRDRDEFDPDADIAGATVTLDDGREGVTGDDGTVRFEALRPRLVCATASADGFESATECLQVPPGAPVLNAIALDPAGAAPTPGATTPPGATGPTYSAGGCRAAPGRLHGGEFRVTLGAVLAAALVVAAARRREPSLRRRHTDD